MNAKTTGFSCINTFQNLFFRANTLRKNAAFFRGHETFTEMISFRETCLVKVAVNGIRHNGISFVGEPCDA